MKVEIYTSITRRVRRGPWLATVMFDPKRGMGTDYTWDFPASMSEEEVRFAVKRRKEEVLKAFEREGKF